jgi:hypothetical protein
MVRAVVDGGQSYAAAVCKFNTTPKTVAKWVKRFRAEGVDGLRDRARVYVLGDGARRAGRNEKRPGDGVGRRRAVEFVRGEQLEEISSL